MLVVVLVADSVSVKGTNSRRLRREEICAVGWWSKLKMTVPTDTGKLIGSDATRGGLFG